jgi:hypothetical protein
MAGHLSVHEQERDDELGIIRKSITLPGGISFESPSRSVARASDSDPTGVKVNEIPRQITFETISSMETGTSALVRDVRSKFIPNALNLSLFDLKFDDAPPPSAVRTVAQYLYSASDKVVTLPTVKSALLKDKGKYPKLSDSRVATYVKMMKLIIDQIEAGNSKPIIGTVPLVAPRFSRQILEAYFSKGIEAFAIDGGTKDIILNEPEFRLILSEINTYKPLNEVFIYACNLGYPLFDKQYSRADDFLGLFAYVDVLGGTFKTRGGPMGLQSSAPVVPRAKLFLSDRYAYEISTYEMLNHRLGRRLSTQQLANHNQRLQLQEANTVRPMIGQESIRRYITRKPAVDDHSLRSLMSIAKAGSR